MKISLEARMMKRFVGYFEERDEYQQGEIYKVIARACMYALYITTFLMLISLIIDTINHTFTFGTIALLIVQQFISYFILFKLKQTGIAETEYDNEMNYTKQISLLKRNSMIAGAEWGFIMLILMEFLFPTLAGESTSISWFTVVLWTVGGGMFGICVYYLQKRNIKLIRED